MVLGAATPVWLLCPTGAGGAGAAEGGAGTACSRVELFDKASSWGLVRPAGNSKVRFKLRFS